MAETGGPVSELKPGGVAVTLSGQPLCDPSRTWAQPAEACRPPPQELHKEHSGSDGFSLRVGGQEKSQCEHFVPYKAPSPPHSLAEKHTPQHPDKAVVTAAMPPPQAGGTVQGIEPPFLPVHRSHLDTTYRPVASLPPLTDTCGLSHHGGGEESGQPPHVGLQAAHAAAAVQHHHHHLPGGAAVETHYLTAGVSVSPPPRPQPGWWVLKKNSPLNVSSLCAAAPTM
ncbi:hypothetical protein CesoFtcFv8_020496 [Champsocephalus esox]|uniref:Uncharacterized protein n=1 Tax=Champsocephalus esox TaxID=159716 RepID=A0AAN8BBK2_9TELE|nr:hypothetical protein CesoFtcFv8_020496 [Champsocephalus esox]